MLRLGQKEVQARHSIHSPKTQPKCQPRRRHKAASGSKSILRSTTVRTGSTRPLKKEPGLIRIEKRRPRVRANRHAERGNRRPRAHANRQVEHSLHNRPPGSRATQTSTNASSGPTGLQGKVHGMIRRGRRNPHARESLKCDNEVQCMTVQQTKRAR